MTGFLGALSDAWAEIRVHKLRVLLSLIGIAVSVGALTAVVAVSEYQRQFQAEQSDRWGGRAATVVVSVNSDDGTPVDADDFDARFSRVSERFGFSHTARIAQGVLLDVQLPEGITPVAARVMDPAFSQIHRERLLEGRWFLDSDVEAMAPPVVITEPLWERLGRVPLTQHPTVTLSGPAGGTYQVVGITPRQGFGDEELRVDLLYDAYRARVDALPADAWTQYEIWMGTGQVDQIAPVLAMDLRAGLPEGQTVTVNRSDWAAQPGALDAQATFEMVTGGIAALILALGALSLINIQLVAMRQRPPFPMRAALIGLLASVIVGAVSGFIPALVALRVKVIDAIRF